MKNISCCGTDCSGCGFYGKNCTGCNQCEGKVFYVPQGKTCPIYECVVIQKQQKNCGTCKELPCAIWKRNRDPKYTDEEFEQNIQERIRMLKQNKQG